METLSSDRRWMVDGKRSVEQGMHLAPPDDRLGAPALRDLNISEIVLEEAPIEHRPGDQVIEQHVRAWLRFRLAGAPAQQATAGGPNCFVQILAYELSTGRSVVLAAARQQLRSGQLDYTTAITFAMPEVGRYQTIGMVLLPEAGAVEVDVGPVFRVLP